MVSLEVLIRGFCVGIAASITVGPVAVLCIQRTLSKNRKSGIVSGLGIAAADSIMAMIAYFCYSILQTHIEQYNQLLRVIAGIFVIIVGVYIFFQNPVPQIRRNRAGRTTLWQDFASIFGLTIANFILVIPYILTFFAVFKSRRSNRSIWPDCGVGLSLLPDSSEVPPSGGHPLRA